MAKSKIDTKGWLKDLGFTDDEITELSPKFESRADKLTEMQLRQSDYDRGWGEIKVTQTALDEANTRLNSEMAQWAELQNKDGVKAKELQASIDKLSTTNFQLTQKLTNLATEYGADPKEILAGVETVEVPVTKPATAPVVDPNLYVPRDQFGRVVDLLLRNPGELHQIAQEHQTLTGKALGDTKGLYDAYLAKAAKDPNVTLRSVWEERDGIPALRTEHDTNARAKEISDAEERGAERVRSEAALPTAHATGHNSPVFTKLHGTEAGGSKLQRPQPGRSATGFAQSLRSGKYRTPQAGAPVAR